MKKIYVAGLIVCIGFLSGCGKKTQTTVINNQEGQTVVENNQNNQAVNETGQTTKMSLKTIFGKSEGQKCVFGAETNGSKQEGIYLIDGKNKRMKMTITVQINDPETNSNKDMVTYGVMEGETIYMWGDQMQGQGMKFSTKVDENNNETAKSMAESVNMEKEYEFSCESWKIDENEFKLPEIQFTDLNEMVKSIEDKLGNGLNMCGLCDKMSGTEKAECQKVYCKN